jgi:hypothetical protein
MRCIVALHAAVLSLCRTDEHRSHCCCFLVTDGKITNTHMPSVVAEMGVNDEMR